MNNDEIEAKIKNIKKTIKTFELEMAKNEERIKNQEKQKQEYIKELLDLGVEITETNVEEVLHKYEAELEMVLNTLEAEIELVRNQIAKNNQ